MQTSEFVSSQVPSWRVFTDYMFYDFTEKAVQYPVFKDIGILGMTREESGIPLKKERKKKCLESQME